jgi:hypothetical protein
LNSRVYRKALTIFAQFLALNDWTVFQKEVSWGWGRQVRKGFVLDKGQKTQTDLERNSVSVAFRMSPSWSLLKKKLAAEVHIYWQEVAEDESKTYNTYNKEQGLETLYREQRKCQVVITVS